MSDNPEPNEDDKQVSSKKVDEAAAETPTSEVSDSKVSNDEPSKATEVTEESAEPLDLPKSVDINAFREKPLSEIYSMLEALPVMIPAKASKSQLVFELVAFYGREGVELEGEGILEQAKDNYAMLRDPVKSFKTSPDDLYISGNLIKEHGLMVGQKVRVRLRGPKGRDKYISACEVLEVEGMPVSEYAKPKSFDHLTAMFPDHRIILENAETGMTPRVLDLVAPLGKGQRGLIVAPPRGGKTIVLKQIAKSIQLNHPEVELIILLLDERPEEVTDFEETVDAEVFSSTFDEPSKRHAQVSDLVMERAKRLVELGKDVVLLLDSLTRLARGHNNTQRNGPIGSGGLSPAALQQSRKFFGAARNCEEGGSLTILATALIETESKMDEVIFEEFKGTGNMEVRLDRELAEQ
ncbi:MAG: transcription termination factor Rho, partial [Verrucomicrobiales bacterium]